MFDRRRVLVIPAAVLARILKLNDHVTVIGLEASVDPLELKVVTVSPSFEQLPALAQAPATTLVLTETTQAEISADGPDVHTMLAWQPLAEPRRGRAAGAHGNSAPEQGRGQQVAQHSEPPPVSSAPPRLRQFLRI